MRSREIKMHMQLCMRNDGIEITVVAPKTNLEFNLNSTLKSGEIITIKSENLKNRIINCNFANS